MKIVATLTGFVFWSVSLWFYADHHGATRIRLANANAVLDAEVKARNEERLKQEKANANDQKQYEDLLTINDKLSAELDRLRERPSRVQVPKGTGVQDKSCSGAELPREDASFLTRLAAEADRAQSEMMACHEYTRILNEDNNKPNGSSSSSRSSSAH